MDQWKRRAGSYDIDFIRALDENFGKHARQRREFLQYSQDIVATLLATTYGIKWHQTVVAKVESGERKVKLIEAYALADIYGVPLEDLAHGEKLDHVMRYKRDERDGRRVIVGERVPGSPAPLDAETMDEREQSTAHQAGLVAEVTEAQKGSDNGEHPETS